MAYILQKSITTNITQESKNKFLRNNGLLRSYEASRVTFEDFIIQSLNDGSLFIKEVNEYLFEELFFGQQRSTYIYKMYSYKKEISNSEQLLEIMNREFGIEEVDMIRITNVYSNDDDKEKRELVGIKVIKSPINGTIKKIRLLFSKKVRVQLKDGTRTENSYIPIEIDLENNILIIKVSPKAKVITDKATPEELAMEYSKKVIKLFQIDIEKFDYIHKETMYKMCQDLYSQVYNKMVLNKPQGVDEVINNFSTTLNGILNIENLDLKKTCNNIFDINDNIFKIVEHLLISDILFSTSDSEIIDGIEGYVTYLRFNDGNNVSARLKGENCVDPIFDSETFMALRAPIDNSKKISILKVVWFNEGKKLRVSYDTSSALYLNIHFYKNLEEGDFYYGVDKYWEYERKSFEDIKRMDSIYSNKVAK
ncbi:hypothetical protein DVV95_11790 [Clostridium botulinum]|uniref:hypothetical protein n=1 Tax=Clostridium botulinum TaxID=1491 RepID=UPI00196757DA|nr:hypothetical protein [Clostridium botulinum]MBN1062486.1 hypothetical protein [Clostridium botulinum]